MQRKKIALLVIAACLYGLVSSQYTPNITEFLNKNEAIWTYMTTTTIRQRRYDCKADVIDDITDDYVLFRSFFGYRTVIRSEWQQFLEGRLWNAGAPGGVRGPAYNAMNVSYRGATPSTTEVLTYLSPDKKCGVVSITDLVSGAEVTRELRVQNSSITAVETNPCFAEYNRTVGVKPARLTYAPSCQDILIGKDNIIPGRPIETALTTFGYPKTGKGVFQPTKVLLLCKLPSTPMFFEARLTCQLLGVLSAPRPFVALRKKPLLMQKTAHASVTKSI
uniref:Lipocalin n=1 Tax=Rhipicephalus zambeziensis TaxID=60191 RepID=A0A224YC25_9ACAR